ncbi:hypothetical protein BGW80DRAFT_1280683 [Lactifluus volemus]|nr:hypothetical protein BGW80DRAFT_1280683 [Lactifluus volemus]
MAIAVVVYKTFFNGDEDRPDSDSSSAAHSRMPGTRTGHPTNYLNPPLLQLKTRLPPELL